jgi:hypothetical protein
MYTMNRCLPSFKHRLMTLALAAGVALTLGAPAAAQTPQRIPPIAQAAQRGMLVVTAPPEVLLDGKATRLSPGARIHGRNNLLVLSGTLVGQNLPVRYTRDLLGQLHEVWILTEAEVAASRP